jgi:ABC-type multidrug transport system fused ATPase/permease subunit
MDGGLENTWLMDFGCSQHMTGDKKWFSSIIPLSHKKYVTFEDDKKGKMLGTDIIKVNDFLTLNDIALVDKLRYNLLSVSRLVDADLDDLFRNLILMFLTLLASMFVASLILVKSFLLIFLVLSLL